MAPEGHLVAAEDHEHLQGGALGFMPVLGQALSPLAPSAGVALLGGLVFSVAGNGAWLSVVVAMVGFLALAAVYAALSARYVTTSGIPGLVAVATGSGGGFALVLVMLFFQLISIPILYVAFAVYGQSYLGLTGVHVSYAVVAVGGVAAVFVAALLAWRDIRISTNFLFIAEMVTIALTVILMLLLMTSGSSSFVDRQQLHLSGVSAHAVLFGVVFAGLAFMGFETSASLGQESKNARKVIPRTFFMGIIIVGVLQIFSMCAAISAAHHAHLNLAEMAVPQVTLARHYHLTALLYAQQLGLVVALFSNCVGVVNYFARFLFTMAREGQMPRWLGHVDPKTHIPHWAVATVASASAIVMVIVALAHDMNIDTYNVMGPAASLVYQAIYLIGALLVLRLAVTKWRSPVLSVCVVIGVLVLGYSIYSSFHPLPSGATGMWLIVGAVGTSVALAAAIVARMLIPKAVARTGSSAAIDTESSMQEDTQYASHDTHESLVGSAVLIDSPPVGG